MVVVGVDGSAESRAALAHALDEAVRRRCWLRVVTAFEPALYPDIAEAELEGEVVRRTREIVNEVLAGHAVGAGPVPVSIVAVPGPPGVALVRESEGTALLVVGHRRRGALTGVLLGSVGLYCVRAASCPVTVVPAGRPDGRILPEADHLSGAASP
jgi:nucleotide-binding universal stress UspA family protein